jgi:MarR family transcriptional regulator, organic hydroperoxide resistance regulator
MSPHVKPGRPRLFSAGLGYYVRALNKSISRTLAAALAEHGVGLEHYYYLRSLFEEDHISQAELSKRVGIESATATRVLATMEREGLIRRTRDTGDRRIVNVTLTPRAKRLEASLRAALEGVNRKYLVGIPESEHAAFRATVLKMLANVGDWL